MKHKHNILVMSAAMAVAPFALSAQTDVQTEEVQDSVYMVKTAFRSVAQGDLLGGVSYVNIEDMLRKNYTTGSLDDMESLVGGWNGTSIWGMDADNNQGYLVLIDGIPRDANNVQPSEIAQITFLKGANAVVLYGSRAAKGAILITTKRGQAREGLKIDLNINSGLHVIKELPEYLSSAEYMKLYNQAQKNDWYDETYGVDYTDEDFMYEPDEIQKTESGVNPYRYVDIDYYSPDYIKKTKHRNEAVLELSGGNNRARLYGNINAYTENDFVKIGDAKDTRINRLSVRGNVDINFNDYIGGHIDANATFYDSKHRQYHMDPGQGMSYWRMVASARSNFPVNTAQLIPLDKVAEDAEGRELLENTSNIFDGCFLAGKANSGFYTNTDQDKTREPKTLFGQIYAGGELKFTSRQFQFDGGLDFNLSKLIEGLSMKTNFGMDFKTSYNTRFDPNYAIFIVDWGDDEMIHKIKQAEGTADEVTGSKKLWGTKDTRTLALSFQFNYERSFGDHNVSALLLGNGFQQIKDGEYHNTTNANLGFDLSYNLAHKYYVQFDLAIPHSAKLAPGHRNALSPSLTLGWNLARESFLEGSIFDDLLISASVSQLNEDIDVRIDNNSYYLYTGSWKADGYQYTWHDGYQLGKTHPTRGENAKLEMIKRKEFSANLKASLLDRFVTVDFTVFKNRMEGYLVKTTAEWPSHMKDFIPNLNNDINSRQGFDFALNFNKEINEIGVSLGLVGTYYDTKVVKKEQSTLDKENQSQLDREGKPIDAIWGYKNLGFFQNAAEVDDANIPKMKGITRPGDIRYADLSNNGEGDGSINTDDMVYLGKDGRFGSPFRMGVNLTVKYQGFTFFALCTAYGGSYGKKNNSYYQPKQNDKYSVIARETWTAENPNAKYPALTTGSTNNYVESDFWLYKNNAFRLSKIQLTYDLPNELLGDSFVKGVSAFVSGKDLLTISKERKVQETVIAGDPKTRFFQVGVKATF